MDHGKATLEGMPVEIQVDIMRQLLKTPYTIELYPQDTHASISWGFGSLGILSVSKHFSAIGLSVLYGENEFSIQGYEYTLAEHDHMEKYDEDGGPVTHEQFKSSRWNNMRNMPNEQPTTVSGIDCLDLISQTHPGQGRLKTLYIRMGDYVLMRFLDGTLLRVLKRLSGLQSLELGLGCCFAHLCRTTFTKLLDSVDWTECLGRDFLLLIQNGLGHIKDITIENFFDGDCPSCHITTWVSHELQKRNKAWVLPKPAYMDFRRTTTSMSVLHPEFVKLLADSEDLYKPKRDTKRVSYLEDTYGVFP